MMLFHDLNFLGVLNVVVYFWILITLVLDFFSWFNLEV